MMGLSDMDKMVSEAVLSEQATSRGWWEIGIQQGDNTFEDGNIQNPSKIHPLRMNPHS
jgi:hypothetical protein